MMNSYEFDQPLDLRLKALNLSLSPFQKNYPALAPSSITNNNSGNNGSCGNINIGHNQDRSTTNSNLNFYNNSSLSTSNNNSQVNLAMHQPQITISNPIPMTISPPSLGFQHQNSNTSSNQHLPNRSSPLVSHQYNQNISGSPQGSSGGHMRHFRSSNIHCQPLNHHQPHPLSRLHPPLPPPPPPNAHHLEVHQQQQQQAQDSSSRLAPQAHPQQPHLPLPTIEQSKQSSPQQQFQHHMSHYHPMQSIGRSLSLSCHPLTSTYSLNSTSPTSNNQYLSSNHQQQQQQLNLSSSARCSPERGSMLQHHHQQQSLMRLGFATRDNNSNSCAGPFIPRDRVTPTSPSSCSPPTAPNTSSSSSLAATASLNTATCSPINNATQQQQHDVSNNQQQHTSANNTASPITRQHSLVSKYNCKPCGIVFSQPETLRAHQESYCTKRDRAHHQTQQIRSQSAVSPSALAQQQKPQPGGTSNNDAATPTKSSSGK